MITRFFRKYLSIVFILATFMGVFHHHDDLKQHNNCQICTLQASIANADTPVATVYLSKIDTYSESILTKLVSLHSVQTQQNFHIRAPPFFS
jgi:hypothetical protein